MSAHSYSLPIFRCDRPSRLRDEKESNRNESLDEQEVVCQPEDRTSGSSISVYFGLGSNLGDRESNMREAIDRIRSLELIVARCSSIYETEPLEYRDQPWFLNQVVEVRMRCVEMTATEANGLNTEQPSGPLVQAEALLHDLLDIEAAMGRARCMPNGPRIIDIDLLLFGELIVGAGSIDGERSEQIRVPHPRMHLRRFVLEPLCEIAPDVVHPVLGRTCCELLAAVDDRAVVRIYG